MLLVTRRPGRAIGPEPGLSGQDHMLHYISKKVAERGIRLLRRSAHWAGRR
jgi:hypothetical protein